MIAENKYSGVGMKMEIGEASKPLRISEQMKEIPFGETVQSTDFTSVSKKEGNMLVRFTKEKDTKNTVKFTEEVKDGQMAIGTLYVQKSALEVIGWTGGVLEVEVKAAD